MTARVVAPCGLGRPRGFAAIGLFNPKTDHNVGSVMRAAQCYDAALVAIQGDRYRKVSTNTLAAERHIPLLQVDDLADAIPFACEPIVIELTEHAESLVTFKHPNSAFYIFGPEDGSVPPYWHKYRQVKSPTRFCMNLAATVNVVLYDRLAKAARSA
ncbi:MAG: TrmH family RNA methyltransferase [Elusimicrobia bacterium]|nr:TrmH family RNA methyltransferase [Elusimicrobiota bacterium]